MASFDADTLCERRAVREIEIRKYGTGTHAKAMVRAEVLATTLRLEPRQR
jgi:hypothetical protein